MREIESRITIGLDSLAWFRANYPNLSRNIWPTIPCDICLLYDTDFIGIDIVGSANDGVFKEVIKANLGKHYYISSFQDFKEIIYDLIGKP
jgi:hypothetical protein